MNGVNASARSRSLDSLQTKALRLAAVERALAEHAARHGGSLERFRASLGNAIVGTPPECAEQLRQYTDYGIGWFFLLFPEPVSVGDLELFAGEVMPEFKSVRRGLTGWTG